MYEILGKLFGVLLVLGVPFGFGTLFGRYLYKFKSWDEFLNDFFS